MTVRSLRIRGLSMLVCAAAGAALGGVAVAQDDPERVSVQIRWIEAQPDGSVFTPLILVAAHDGSVDFFDHDRPAKEPLEYVLRQINETDQGVMQLIAELEERWEGAVVRGLGSRPLSDAPPPFPVPPGSLMPRYQIATMLVDPQQHRFASWLAPIHPGDDAFLANEDPFEIELFDADGRFRGPFHIDLYGGQVMDAGLCANNETGLVFLDRPWATPAEPGTCTNGEGLVQAHPGLNGSVRNPDGEPRNVLGGSFELPDGTELHYDPEIADFSRPGHRIGRLVITRGGIGDYAPTGSWYSPDHDGEGFNIELVAPEPGDHRPRLYAHWYTYTPDGSGEQAWLTGIAPVENNTGLAPGQEPVWIELLQTHGGRFASDDNPDTVERLPWGRIGLSFSSCTEGHVVYEPDDEAWPAGEYPIYRLSPAIEGLGWLCDSDKHPDD